MTLVVLNSVLATPPVSPPSAFVASARALSDVEQAAMVGVSWHEGCPVGPEQLVRLEVSTVRPDGSEAPGVLVVHQDAAAALTLVFQALWDARFPIASAVPIEAFAGNDDASMAANNTSAFNCRGIDGGSTFSQHAHGLAVDVNPLWNPYVKTRKGTELIKPPAGRDWMVRKPGIPGLITPGDAAVEAFRAAGWRWGGAWSSAKDYQHFSRSGG